MALSNFIIGFNSAMCHAWEVFIIIFFRVAQTGRYALRPKIIASTGGVRVVAHMSQRLTRRQLFNYTVKSDKSFTLFSDASS